MDKEKLKASIKEELFGFLEGLPLSLAVPRPQTLTSRKQDLELWLDTIIDKVYEAGTKFGSEEERKSRISQTFIPPPRRRTKRRKEKIKKTYL